MSPSGVAVRRTSASGEKACECSGTSIVVRELGDGPGQISGKAKVLLFVAEIGAFRREEVDSPAGRTVECLVRTQMFFQE